MTAAHRKARPHRLGGRHSRIISAVVALVLAGSLGAPAPVAFADSLEDQQAALKDQAARVQDSLEFVDAKIAQRPPIWWSTKGNSQGPSRRCWKPKDGWRVP
ncbi:hypothetical protein AHiyo6_28180 [Arthrobacter sp. Hiyo6]|nr:hypothetical protein AHiyo6_28180 [Arthrobacter sp. Hiyo6]